MSQTLIGLSRVSNSQQKIVIDQLSVIQIDLLQPWLVPGRVLTYDFKNITYQESEISLLKLESLLIPNTKNHIQIRFTDVKINGINLKGKTSLVETNFFAYQDLYIIFQNCQVSNSSVVLGSMFLFHHSAKTVNMTMLTLFNNTGEQLIIEPLEVSGIQQYLQVNLVNSSLKNNSASQTLIYISKGSQLAVVNSLFQDNYSIGRASVIFAEKDNARVNILASNFSQNYAQYGGVFFSQLNGFISCERCILRNNFALYGGVLFSQNEGQAVFKQCLLTNNAAMRASLIYSINSQSNIIIDGGTITQNKIWAQKETFDLLLFKNKTRSYQQLARNFSLPFIKGMEDNLKVIKAIATTSALTASGSTSGTTSNGNIGHNFQIQAIKSTIMMLGMLKVIDQEQLLQAQSASVIKMSNLTIQDVNTDQSMLEFDQVQFQINGMNMININTTHSLVTLNSDSSGVLSNINAKNIDGPFIFSDTCNITISDVQLRSIKSRSSKNAIMDFRKTIVVLHRAVFEKVSMNASGGSAPAIIFVSENSRALIDSLQVNHFNSELLKVSYSNLVLFNSNIQDGNNLLMYTQQSGLAISIMKSSAELENCTFAYLSSRVGPAIHGWDSHESNNLNNITVVNSTFYGNYALQSGGAVMIQDVTFYTQGSQYELNKADLGDGGALFLSWSMKNKKMPLFETSHNTFQSNSAQKKGGAIFYDLFSPSQLINNTYQNNDAQYGKDYASYPFKLKLMSESKSALIAISPQAGPDSSIIQLNPLMVLRTEYYSGEQLKRNLIIGIYDQNDQIVSTDSSSEGILSSVDIKLIISGNNKVIAQNGIFNFSNLKFIAQPDYNSSIRFTSDALDSQKIEKVSSSLQQDLTDYIYFRKCFSGEAIVNNQCQGCTKGFYSFSQMSKGCTKCFQNGVCNGGNNVGVQKGFFRTSNISENAYLCPEPSSCIGGTNLSNQCSVGYTGRMCNTCVKEEINGTFYARAGTYGCSACSPLGVQLLIMLLFFAGFGLYLTYLLYSLIQNPSRNKPQTVLLRIITNYSQAIMIVYEFDLKWPPQVKDALTYFSFIQSSQEYVFSTDCIAKQMGFEVKTSMFFIKVIVYGLMPLISILIAGCFWFIIYIVKKYRDGVEINIKQNIRVTFFIIVYLMYPSISNLSFSLFNCFSFDDNVSYMRRDFEIKCKTNDHLKMALSIGIPYILVWVIAFPVYIFRKLKSLRDNFNDKDVITSYGLFFIGLHDKAFFWEIVVTNARKLAFIICSTLFSSSSAIFKALIGSMVLFLQMQLLHYYNPYIDPRFNTIEHLAIYASMFTVFAGLFFLESESQTNNQAKVMLFLLVLAFNIYFLCNWLHRICDVTFRTQVSRFREWSCCRFLRRRKVNDYDKDLSLVLQSVKEEKSTFSKRFFMSRMKTGRQWSINEQHNQIDYEESFNSNQFENYQKPNWSNHRYIYELSDGRSPDPRDGHNHWGLGDHQYDSSSQNNSFVFSSYPRKLEPQPLIVDMKHLTKKRMISGNHQRGGGEYQDVKGGASRRNIKQSVGFTDQVQNASIAGFNGEEQEEGASFSRNHYHKKYRQYRGRQNKDKKQNEIQDRKAKKQKILDRLEESYHDESQDESIHITSSSEDRYPGHYNKPIGQTNQLKELKGLQAPSTLKDPSHQKQKQKSQSLSATIDHAGWGSRPNPNLVAPPDSEGKLHGIVRFQTGSHKDTLDKKKVPAKEEESEKITGESKKSSSSSSSQSENPSSNTPIRVMPSHNKFNKQNKKGSSSGTENHSQGKDHESNQPVGDYKQASKTSKSPIRQGPQNQNNLGLRRQLETIREYEHRDKTTIKVGGSHLRGEDHQHPDMKDAREPQIQSNQKKVESKNRIKSVERSKHHSNERREPKRKESSKR